MARKKHEEHDSSERWLLTYADLITLLLGLFVILYSMSQVDLEKYKSMGEALRSVFLGKQGIVGIGASAGAYQGPELETYADTTELYLSKRIFEVLGEFEFSPEMISVEMQERGIVVRLMETLMFELGKARLLPDAQEVLARMSPVFIRSGRLILIEGHTDNLPIHTIEFASNWQLSAMRAANVVYFLTRYASVPEGEISSASYADQRPIADNRTPEGRQKNRRVDIVFLKERWKSHQSETAQLDPSTSRTAKATQEH
ncbi:MAG: flagellar motor protein MotB [bacterium]